MKEVLNIDNLLNYYKDISMKPTVGIDKVGRKRFEKDLIKNLELVIKKGLNGSYCFSPYKLTLIPKGVEKKPRKICIPTIRDKVMLRALKEVICKYYTYESGESKFAGKSIKTIIEDITNTFESGKYDMYIKLDITSFYDNIDHEILIEKLRKEIDDEKIISLIKNAISRKQVYENYVNDTTIGVPQGLAISNILANIYLDELDKKYSAMDILYNRYVDDIFIMCNSEDADNIQRQIVRELKMKYFLEVNESKCEIASTDEGVSYLGYRFENKEVSVRESSIKKIEKAIEALFVTYNNLPKERKNIEKLIWSLNLKITGGIYDNKKYGWLFFYSQITNKKLLFHLDDLINKYIKRFKLPELNGRIKKFSRTYCEIRKNLRLTQYIPKFDLYTIEQKKVFLKNVCEFADVESLSERDIENNFRKNIFKNLKELERDLQYIS